MKENSMSSIFIKGAFPCICLALAAMLLSACAECKTSQDCDIGQVCQGGKCKVPGSSKNTDSNTGWSTGGDTTTEKETTTGTGTGTGTGTHTSTETSSDTGTGEDSDTVIEETLPNGAVCNLDKQCLSGHCGSGYCCADGECCPTPGSNAAECSNSLCTARSCTANHQCVYSSAHFPCGSLDTGDGDTCAGNNRCDGSGNCVPYVDSCAPFAPIVPAQVTCAEGVQVQAVCHTSCTAQNQGTTCDSSVSASCQSGVCVAGTNLPNGSSCGASGQCASGHCANGFCCADGECCAQATDCSGSLCKSRFCSNFTCVYSNTPCGYEDAGDGDTCTGDNRCDGTGQCRPVYPCSGAYAWNGGFSCTPGLVTENCRDWCANNTHCNSTYVCDDGSCVQDSVLLPNGAICTEPAQCHSGHCEGGLCCPGGQCCAVTTDCDDSACMTNTCDGNHQCIDYPVMCGASDGSACADEFLCDGVGECVFVDVCDGAYAETGYYVCGPEQVEQECYLSCTTESQCNPGHYCVGKACIYGIPNGMGPCTEHGDCASGYCSIESGLCCGGSGDDRCCASAADCNDSETCTVDYCDDDKVCRHDPVPDYAPCANDLFCDGYEVCFGGVCAALEPDPCELLRTPCREVWCDEEGKACRWRPIHEGDPCSDEPLYCTGDYLYCQEGLCVSKTAGNICEAPEDPCMIAVCHEDEQKCEYQTAPDGTACGDDDLCNGLEVCANGGCVILPGSVPCDDGDFCTTQTCTWDAWNGVVCGDPVSVPEGAPCVGADAACLGAATCQSDVCVPAQERTCNQGNICIQEACAVVNGVPTCTPDLPGTVNELECDELIEVRHFSRQYYSDSYQGSACAGQPVSGLEAGMTLTLDAPASVTLRVEEMDPEVAATLLAVTDLCDPSGVSCYAVQDGTGALIVMDLPAGTHSFLLETDQDLGPGVAYSAQVRVTCN